MGDTTSLLPPFTVDGVLPPGDYELTLDELAASMLVVGPPTAAATWDRAWRAQLVQNLGIMMTQLWQRGNP